MRSLLCCLALVTGACAGVERPKPIAGEEPRLRTPAAGHVPLERTEISAVRKAHAEAADGRRLDREMERLAEEERRRDIGRPPLLHSL